MDSEKEIEQYLRERIRELGGRAYKFVSPGNNGVPDRIVMINGQAYFTEMKRPGGVLSKNQILQLKRLRGLGMPAGVLGSREDVDAFLSCLGSPQETRAYLERQAEKYGV